LDRCLDAIDKFLSPHGSLTLAASIARLRAYLREAILGAYEMWERSATHECRGTRCIRAMERPVIAGNDSIDVSVPRCSPKRIQCSVHEFFDRNRAIFAAIEKRIGIEKDPSKELKRTAETISLARTDPKFLCDDQNCSAMSDAIIATDGLHADHFAANNDKEWLILAAAIGKPLLNPVSGIFTEPSRPRRKSRTHRRSRRDNEPG